MQILQYDGARGLLTARVEHEYQRNQGWFATIPLRSEKLRLYLEIFVKVDAHGRLELTANAPLDSWVDELTARLHDRLAKTPEWVKQTSGYMQHATSKTCTAALRPGEELTEPFRGTLRDDSGYADKQEVSDLHRSGGGVLPLGRWTFATTDKDSDHGEMLYLNPFAPTGALREHNGTLICAPQNSGKTALIVRWAIAANQAGYNLLLIDVKGNLRERLTDANWRGELYYFSTDPRDQQSDAVNFLDGLDPTTPEGTLYNKTTDFNTRRHFQFEWIADVVEDEIPNRGPVTVIEAARGQDLDDDRSTLSLSVTKLLHALFERMQSRSRQRIQRPVLLLLDETRRIRNFKTNEYVSFARQAEAGCVVVYQSLDHIGDERQIIELLENVGTQIYLGSLVGNTAKYCVASLPKRFRPTFSVSSTIGNDGASKTLQTGQEMVDYFTTAELYVLPAGRYPALVYLNDQPRREPILVAMDRDVTGL